MDIPAPALSSELLGFAADARVLILNCDDFGLDEDVNAAVAECVEQGVASSCSVMVPAPAAAGALQLLRERPEMPFGVHLTLVCERPRRRWGPVAPRASVPSLLDEAGELFAPTPAGRARLLAGARTEEVEREFRAQIDAVSDAGLHPTHLDFHCLADAGRDDLLDLTLALGAEYGLAVRVWLAPGLRTARLRGLPVVDHGFLDSFSLPLDDKAAHYARLLAELPPGLSEWAVHPGTGGPDSRATDDGWRVRRGDYEFLTSPRARELLAEHGITVIDYRPLQALWPGPAQQAALVTALAAPGPPIPEPPPNSPAPTSR
ncbi:polysaccharide deacetylase family protein [Kitasatospora sp. RG8]|uniref:polysaccharide deacetylase family protein n=1 Tax=Kitasatospora sp. RG8 TaxID=2820815 RepID=UPI001ADF756B|nr:polysaccharide deacetylase family protein [Kitasatospora sp. RG8]MBP0448581.1 polysaccharide deacetylase family protein [Kitasatospora sp. RG8]